MFRTLQPRPRKIRLTADVTNVVGPIVTVISEATAAVVMVVVGRMARDLRVRSLQKRQTGHDQKAAVLEAQRRAHLQQHCQL